MSKHQTIVPLIGNIGTLGTSQHQASKLSTRHGGNVKHGMHAKKRTQSRKAGKELKSRNAGNGMGDMHAENCLKIFGQLKYDAGLISALCRQPSLAPWA